MEWIRISDNKLKIMLTAEDARRYALNCEAADYTELLTREAFREILSDVRVESGFDAADEKLYIQMYPSKGGGCELFVTKMGLPAEMTVSRTPPATPRPARRAPRIRRYAFCFDGLSSLLAVCERLAAIPYTGKSEVWREERGDWWLLLTDDAAHATLPDPYRFVSEYGRPAVAGDARLYLSEHARQICPASAVALFATL